MPANHKKIFLWKWENMLEVEQKLSVLTTNSPLGMAWSWMKTFYVAFAILVPEIAVNNINTTDMDAIHTIRLRRTHTFHRYCYYYIFMYRYCCPFVRSSVRVEMIAQKRKKKHAIVIVVYIKSNHKSLRKNANAKLCL